MSERVLITGGSGFIGTNLVEHYLNEGRTVLNLDHSAPRNGAHRDVWKNIDLLDADGLTNAFQEFQPTLVLHMGARTDLHGASLSDYAANVEGVENTVAAVAATPSIRRVIYASTRFVFNHGVVPKHMYDYSPHTVYGQSKVKTEEIVRAQSKDSVPWVLVRPTSIWGPWFAEPYKRFFDSIAANRYLHPGNLRLPKSYGFVGNAVHQIAKFADEGDDSAIGKALFVADYEPLDVFDWATMIQKELKVSPIRKVSYPVLKSIAVVGDLLQKGRLMKNPPLTSFRLRNLITPLVYDMTEVERIVGPLPYSLAEGVDQTVGWMNSRSKVAGADCLVH